MLDAAWTLGLLVMVRAENDSAVRWLTEKLVAKGRSAMCHHTASRAAIGDSEAAYRAIALSEIVVVLILIADVSATGVVDEIRRAQAPNLRIPAETCQQYLYLSEADLDQPSREGTTCVCTQPRTLADQRAVFEGFAGDTLAVFSFDYSPWRFTDKLGSRPGFHNVPNGIPGVKTRLPLLFSEGVMAERRRLSPASNAPRRHRHGSSGLRHGRG